MKRTVKAVTPDVPIFGVDTAEVEALRQLAAVVGAYLGESIDIGELEGAYHHWLKVKRSKRSN